jgi:SAM-dependent methyltransferase
MDEPELSVLIETIMPTILERLRSEKPWRDNILVPSMDAYRVGAGEPFMQYSSCASRDFFHPEFKRLSQLIGVEEIFHRKHWEWVFIVYQAYQKQVVGPGKRGIVFGVGEEMLPSVFAKAGTTITATDAPLDIGVAQGWQATTQYAAGLAALPSGDMDRAEFERRVEWRECDMNAIDPAFTDYDFCWSSCCLEHLGDLRKGLDFVLNSVERVLKVGGVAIHTTEFNLSSNTDTIEAGDTVLYRRGDFDAFVEEVRARGHKIEPFRVAPDSLVIDGYVDTPPFAAKPHLRLRLGGFAATSAGLVITRGR